MTIIKCINFRHIILAPPTILVKIRHWFSVELNKLKESNAKVRVVISIRNRNHHETKIA